MKKYRKAIVSIGNTPQLYSGSRGLDAFESSVQARFGEKADEVIIDYVFLGESTVQFIRHDGSEQPELEVDLSFAFESKEER